MQTYLDFIRYVEKDDVGLDNYVHYDRTLNVDANSNENLEDAHGRALYAIARTCALTSLPPEIREKAWKMFKRNFEKGTAHLQSPRAVAFSTKGLSALLPHADAHTQKDIAATLMRNGNHLLQLYDAHHSRNWLWFEPYLTYSNAVLSEALLCAYQAMPHREEYFTIGKKSLDFLIDNTFEAHYVPIGQDGWFHKDAQRQYFDQQPEDVTTMIEALKTMYDITGSAHYKELIQKAFQWFLGHNHLQQMVYDPITGGCHDGVGQDSINLNQGAESTISYLLARLAIEDLNL